MDVKWYEEREGGSGKGERGKEKAYPASGDVAQYRRPRGDGGGKQHRDTGGEPNCRDSGAHRGNQGEAGREEERESDATAR